MTSFFYQGKQIRSIDFLKTQLDIEGQVDVGVYLVRYPGEKKNYALQIIKITDQSILQKLRWQMHLWKRIHKHNNILELLDYEISSDNFVKMLFDVSRDGTLKRFVDSSYEPISESKILDILFQVASAIKHMHSSHPPIFHGGIRPNLILNFGGKIRLSGMGSLFTNEFDPR